MKSPIIKRIIVFGVLNGILSLALATIGFGIFEFYKIKNELISRVDSQMDMLAYNLEPTLVFDDSEAATKILKSLQDDPSTIRAVVYSVAGKEFASFKRSDRPADLKRSKFIQYNHKNIGYIDIESVYVGLMERFLMYAMISLLIILITMPISYFVSAPIRKQVYAAVIQLEKQSDRLRLLADQVLNTEQKERKRIAALVHDHLQQILVAIKLQVSQSMKAIENKQYDKASDSLQRGEKFLSGAILAAKSLTVELRPPVLYEDGLGAAFQWLSKKFKEEHDLQVVTYLEEIPPNLPDSLKIMLYESVKELLFNVVKYSGVDKAELFMQYTKGLIKITVKDKGRGFDATQVEKVSSEKGFGLFSIRERLKILKGSLKIDSTPWDGTTLEITIPVNVEIESPSDLGIPVIEEESGDDGNKNRHIRVLLVDDHALVREGIANILKENSLIKVVAQAENGMEAIEKVENYRPEVVVMDINMPKLNGIEATRIIKKKYPYIDIIGLSVQDERDVSDSFIKAGASTLINKAGDPQELIKAILVCVGK
ncbi:MAG: response regulator [Candidatus Omnitrophica bacterium]|nr:response regulator [Candidatus Omnitrophota bacterium]